MRCAECDGEADKLALVDERLGGGVRRAVDVGHAGDDRGDRGPATVVGDVNHVELRLCFQHLGDDEGRSPHAARRIVELAGLSLGLVDQLFQGFYADLGMRHHHVEARRKATGQNEILLDVVSEVLVERLAERKIGVGLKDRVAVGSSPCGGGRGDRPSGPRAVHHDDRLAENPGERFGDDAPDDIRRTARPARHDVADGPLGPCVGLYLGVGVPRQHTGSKHGETCCNDTKRVECRITPFRRARLWPSSHCVSPCACFRGGQLRSCQRLFGQTRARTDRRATSSTKARSPDASLYVALQRCAPCLMEASSGGLGCLISRGIAAECH